MLLLAIALFDGLHVKAQNDGDLTENTEEENETEDLTPVDPPAVEYVCGEAASTYTTLDSAILCLFFDQMEPPMKVVFSTTVDKFEVLQIKGLYKKFEAI